MKLRAISWNLRRAKSDSKAWNIISQLDPDILFLQEVVSIPKFIVDTYSFKLKSAVNKSGKDQIFGTAILTKGEIQKEIQLKSEKSWVQNEIEFFKGNLISCQIKFKNGFTTNIVSAYCPAWPVDKKRLEDIDVSDIKLKLNPDVWCTEILWAALKEIEKLKNENWIVAGDLNSSATFDYMWSGGPRGNQEFIERMNSLGLTECLYHSKGELTPTFRNPKGGKVIHQIDHMYVTNPILNFLIEAKIGDENEIFGNSISDHLPIISDFNFLKS